MERQIPDHQHDMAPALPKPNYAFRLLARDSQNQVHHQRGRITKQRASKIGANTIVIGFFNYELAFRQLIERGQRISFVLAL